MGLLTENIEEKVKSKVKYPLKTDYRTAIKFEWLMQDGNIPDKEKIVGALLLFYGEIPEDIEKAVEDILWFYGGGKEENTKKEKKSDAKVQSIYSFEFDDDLIYSAFLDQYGLDLQINTELHWWKFKAMFKALKEDNKIVEIMGYRAIDLTKIKDKSEREKYRKLKKLYALPDMRSEEEKERDFNSAFSF